MIDCWYDKVNNVYFATNHPKDLLQYIIDHNINNILDIIYIEKDNNNEKIFDKLFKK